MVGVYIIGMFLSLLLAVAFVPALAAPVDAGTLLREFREPPALPRQELKFVPEPAPPADAGKEGIKIRVTGFDLEEDL